MNLSDAAPHIQTLLDLDAHLVPCYLRDGRKPPVRGHDQKQPWTGTAQAFLKTGAKLVGIVPRSVGVVAFDSDKPGGREKCKELHGEPLAEYKTHRADGWHLLYPAPTGKVDATWEYGEIRCDVAQGYIIAWDTKQWCKAAQHIWDTAANLASSVDEIVSGNKTDTKFPATKLTPKSLVGLKKGHGHSIQDRIFHGAMRDAAAGRLTEARREQWQKAGVATGHTAAVVRRNIQRGEAAAKARASGIMDHQLIIVGGQPRVLTPDGRELRQSALDAMFGRRNLDHWKTSKEKKVWPLGYYLNAHPRKLPDGAYGTWRGFTVEPKQGDWSLYRALLLEMVEGSEDNLRWLLNWMAHAVQLPGEPAGQCVVMASPTKWIGKSEAGYYFRSLFGPHAIEVGPARNILGKFNYLLHNKVVVQVDEDALTRNIGTLKHILTARTIKVERKGLEPEIVPNCLHLWATTNELAVAPDDSRRFACFECGTSYAANIAAFRAIEAQLQSGGYAALLYDLKQWDCLILDPPATSLRADSLRSGPEWEWWDSVQAMVQDAETVVPSSLLDGWRKVVRVGGLPQMSRWLNAHQDVTHFTKERIRTGSRDEVRWVFGGSDGDDLF